MTTSVWNFLNYVTFGINVTSATDNNNNNNNKNKNNNNNQLIGEELDEINKKDFNRNISEISNIDKCIKNDLYLQNTLCSPTNTMSAIRDLDDEVNIDNSHNKQEQIELTKFQYCKALDGIIEKHSLPDDVANEIRSLTERLNEADIPRNNFISNNQIIDTSLNGLHYTKLEVYISSQEFVIDIESFAQRFSPEIILIRLMLKQHSEFGSSIVDIRKIIQYMNDIRQPSKTNTNRMNMVKFIAKFWDSCEHVDSDRPGNYKYFMLFNAIANYVTDNKQFLRHAQLYHVYPMFSPFDVQYVLINKVKKKYNYIPSPKRVKI